MARILIVDDNQTLVDMLSMTVKLLGHSPIPALGGQQALDLIAQQEPDLMLLDLMMPGMDGYETLRRLRAEGGTFPVIVVTASEDDHLEERVVLSGGDACLRKPVDIDRLAELIEHHLEVSAGVPSVQSGAPAGETPTRMPTLLSTPPA